MNYILRVLLFMSLCFLSLTIQSQKLKFKELEDMPESRMALQMVTDGRDIYAVGGYSPGKKTGIIKYNVQTNTWSVLTDSVASRQFGCASLIYGTIYTFNGIVKKNSGINAEEINVTTGLVKPGKPSPVACRSAGCAEEGNYIYIFGGSLNKDTLGDKPKKAYTNKLFRFDVASKTWTELAAMPVARETSGEIINGRLYVIGGYNGKTLDRLDVYDIASNTWQAAVTLPDSISAHATCIYKNRIYIVGDYHDKTRVASYDIVTGKYIKYKTNIKPRRHSAAIVVNGKLYVAGGNETPDGRSSIASFEVADLNEE